MRADERPGLGAVYDVNCRWEFGGPVGTLAMMLGFPCLMCKLFPLGSVLSNSLFLKSIFNTSLPNSKIDYLWICLWHFQGRLVHPTSLSWDGKGGVGTFLSEMVGIVKKVRITFP
jgi:hypothetical protein